MKNALNIPIAKDTLPYDYIMTKVKSYVEPLRAGTPRGEKIGISKEKYLCALLVATTLKKELKEKQRQLKDIAASLGMSYNLVRQWNIEPDFQKLVADICEEFARTALNYSDVYLHEGKDGRNTIFSNTDTYSDCVINKIEELLLNDMEKYNDAFDKDGIFNLAFMQRVDMLFLNRREDLRLRFIGKAIEKLTLLKGTRIDADKRSKSFMSKLISQNTPLTAAQKDMLTSLCHYFKWYIDGVKTELNK